MQLVKIPGKTFTVENVRVLHDLIDISARKDERYFKWMQTLRDAVKGKQWAHLNVQSGGVAKKEGAQLNINLAHAHVRSLAPTLFFKNPVMRSQPTARQHQGKERTWDSVINATNDRIGFVEVFDSVVFDSIVYPEAWFKWAVNMPAEGEDALEHSESGQSGPSPWLSKSAPIPVRLSPPQVIVDYRATGRDPAQARFVTIRYLKTLEELKADPRYTIDEGFQPAVKGSSGLAGSKGNDSKRMDPFELLDTRLGVEQSNHDTPVIIYETWIHQLVQTSSYQQVVWTMEGHAKPIRQVETWEAVMGQGFNEYPIYRVVLNPVPDEVPVSEIGAFWDLQVATNWLTSRLVDITEQEQVIVEVEKEKLKNPEVALEQLRSGKTSVFVEVKELGAFNTTQPTFVPRDNYQLLSLLQQFQQQVAGIGMNRKGGSGIRTATEASIVESGVQIKTSKRVEDIRRALQRIFTGEVKIIRSIAKSQGTQWVLRVAGSTGAVDWLDFTDEDLDWLPEVRIEADSFRKKDNQEDTQKLMTAIGLGIQLMQLGMSVRVDVMYRTLLEYMEIPERELIMGDATQQMMQQSMEIVMLLNGQEAPVSSGDDHGTHSQIIQQFMNSEGGQALAQANPQGMSALNDHNAQHEQALQQMQQSASQLGSGPNVFETGAPVDTPANNARQATALDRNVVGQAAGSGGQFNT